MWHENKEISDILNLFFDEAIGKDSYIIENDDLIDFNSNPKSGLDCWVRLDKNLKKSINLKMKKIDEMYLKDENNNPTYLKNPAYKRPNKSSILTSLIFDKIIISKDENKALKKMKQANRERYEMGMFEEDVINYNGVDYFIIWD